MTSGPDSGSSAAAGNVSAARTAFRRVNAWATNLSPWGYAALIASGMLIGQAGGIMIGRWLGGADLWRADDWYGILAAWLVVFLFARLLAPATLQTMRLQQQWREERRRQRRRESTPPDRRRAKGE